jgi:photosystem II stability/assembly factor-like uncharacterized protein
VLRLNYLSKRLSPVALHHHQTFSGKIGVDATVAQSTYGKLIAGGVDVKLHPDVVSLLSQAMSDARVKEYLRCAAIKAGTLSVEQSIYLDVLNLFLTTKPTANQFIEWQREHPYPVSSPSSPRAEGPPGWKNVDIVEKAPGKARYLKAPWTDIAWVDSDGWLCGVLEEGGGGGNVGTGILLRTRDGGITWSEVPKANFDAETGKFAWGPCTPDEPKESCARHYWYQWNEVGPIKSMLFWRAPGEEASRGFLAAATGIYLSEDNGEHWKRSTPKPSERDGYALFSRIADIEGLHEIYAVGWQGISHWPDPSGKWELQLPTYSYAISSILVGPDREVWAVGHAPNIDRRSYVGAVYYLAPRTKNWVRVPLTGIDLAFDQSFNDILLLDYKTALVVGQQGLILRGMRDTAGDWRWARVTSNTDATLNSIAYADNRVWVVGEGGVTMWSVNKGESWTKLAITKDDQGFPINLKRVRFVGHTGWILGDGIVLRTVVQQ